MCVYCRAGDAMDAFAEALGKEAVIAMAKDVVEVVHDLGLQVHTQGKEANKPEAVAMVRGRCSDDPAKMALALIEATLQLTVWRRAVEAVKGAMLEQADEYAKSEFHTEGAAEREKHIDATMAALGKFMPDTPEEQGPPKALLEAIAQAMSEGKFQVIRVPKPGPQGPQGN